MAASRLSITLPSPGSSDSRSSKAPISASSAGVFCVCVRTSMVSRRLADHAGITVGLQVRSQILVAGLDDLAPVENVNRIRHDVFQKPLVVGDDDDGAIGRTQRIDAVSNDLQRIDGEPGVRLQNGRGVWR